MVGDDELSRSLIDDESEDRLMGVDVDELKMPDLLLASIDA